MFFKKYYPYINDEKFIIKNYKIIIKGIFMIFLLSLIYFENSKFQINYNYEIDKINKQTVLSPKKIKLNVLSEISEEFITNLKNILKNDEIIENEMLNKYTTFRIGGPAIFFVKPKKIDQIKEIIQLCNKYKIYYFILGNGSNLLVSDTGYKGVVIQIHEYNFSKLEIKRENEENFILTVGGGMLMKTLAIEACLLSLTGFEDIIDIPGTVGAGIIMNASFRSEGLARPLTSVKVITNEGKILKLSKTECKLGRRGSMLKVKKYIVIEATFKLKKGDKMIIQKKMAENT